MTIKLSVQSILECIEMKEVSEDCYLILLRKSTKKFLDQNPVDGLKEALIAKCQEINGGMHGLGLLFDNNNNYEPSHINYPSDRVYYPSEYSNDYFYTS